MSSWPRPGRRTTALTDVARVALGARLGGRDHQRGPIAKTTDDLSDCRPNAVTKSRLAPPTPLPAPAPLRRLGLCSRARHNRKRQPYRHSRIGDIGGADSIGRQSRVSGGHQARNGAVLARTHWRPVTECQARSAVRLLQERDAPRTRRLAQLLCPSAATALTRRWLRQLSRPAAVDALREEGARAGRVVPRGPASRTASALSLKVRRVAGS